MQKGFEIVHLCERIKPHLGVKRGFNYNKPCSVYINCEALKVARQIEACINEGCIFRAVYRFPGRLRPRTDDSFFPIDYILDIEGSFIQNLSHIFALLVSIRNL